MSDLTKLTRQELYDLVWAEPATTIAVRHGVSGRAIGKLCERRQVPVPPRGYWAKAGAGKAVAKPDLPEFVEPPASAMPPKPPKRDALQELLERMRERANVLPDPGPDPELDPPTRDYSFHVTKWDWRYQVGAQGPRPTRETPRSDVFPEFENIDMEGVLHEPTELESRFISLALEPIADSVKAVDFRETSRAHIGAIEFFEASIAARAALPESAASRLVQILIAGRPIEVTLTTEPDGQPEQIIVTMSFNGQRIGY